MFSILLSFLLFLLSSSFANALPQSANVPTSPSSQKAPSPESLDGCVEGKRGVIVHADFGCCAKTAAAPLSIQGFSHTPDGVYAFASSTDPTSVCLTFDYLHSNVVQVYPVPSWGIDFEAQYVGVGLTDEGNSYAYVHSRKDDQPGNEGSGAYLNVVVPVSDLYFKDAYSWDSTPPGTTTANYVIYGQSSDVLYIKYCHSQCASK